MKETCLEVESITGLKFFTRRVDLRADDHCIAASAKKTNKQ
jgi:hypothetical protein